MLIRFTIENYLSFREREVFSLIPGKGTLKPQHKTFPIKGTSVLKTAVIFGANASGKSNLIKGIEFGQNLILKGTKSEQPITFDFFKLDKNSIHGNLRFEYEIQHKNKNYAYGFILNSKEIVEEWLYELNKKSEKKIFERTNSNEFDLSFLIKKNKKDQIQFIQFIAKSTPRNQLFLTHIKNNNVTDNVTDISDILNIIDWFQNALNVFYPNSKNIGKKFELLQNTDLQLSYQQMLDYFDTGINGIDLKEIDFNKMDVSDKIKEDIKINLLNEKSDNKAALLSNSTDDEYYIITKSANNELIAKLLKTKHKIIDGDFELFDFKNESDGTRRIIDLIPLVIDFFKGGKVFIIDEIDRSLHPNLIFDLFDFILGKCNKINSQFIVATHESTLLTQKLLRKDEIWFVVKDSKGISHLHSLEDYNIRFDKEVRKDYLLGRYKGIPKIGNRENLNIFQLNKD